MVTIDGFLGLTGYVNCVRLHNSHVLKRCSLNPMHALFTIDHGTETGQHFRGHLESHDFSNPSVLIGLPSFGRVHVRVWDRD